MTELTNEPIRSKAVELRDRVARELESKSYERLQEFLTTLSRDEIGLADICSEDTPHGTLHVCGVISEWGLIRRRISVELTVHSEDGSVHPGVVPCIYFERFATGRIIKPVWRGTVAEIAQALTLVLALALIVFAILLLLMEVN